MRSPVTARVFALALLLLATPVAEAGWVIVDENGHETALSRGRLKTAPKDARDVSMMLDIGRGRMWVADAEQRRFWEGSVEEFCQAMRGGMAGVMEEALKDMSPAEREQMQQIMKGMRGGGAPGGAPPRVTVERTNETTQIAGLSARKFRVLSNGKLYEELWITTDPALLREMELSKGSDTVGRMSGCLAGMAGAEPPESTPEFRKLYSEGFPLKVVYYGDAGGSAGRTVSTVSKVEQRDIPEREFTPPAGYRAAPLMEVFGAERRR